MTEAQEYTQSNLRKTTEVWNKKKKNLKESERQMSNYHFSEMLIDCFLSLEGLKKKIPYSLPI